MWFSMLLVFVSVSVLFSHSVCPDEVMTASHLLEKSCSFGLPCDLLCLFVILVVLHGHVSTRFL